jgi:hypothetical protein
MNVRGTLVKLFLKAAEFIGVYMYWQGVGVWCEL